MTLHPASWRPALLASLAAVALGGCGPEAPLPDEEPTKDALGVTSQSISSGGHDYLFVRTPKTWQQAQSLCSVNGYKLVTIDNATEEAFLAVHEAYAGLYNWWIGYNDIGTEGFFVWDGPTSSYTNWYPGEPTNNSNEDCVADRFSYGSSIRSELWNDAPCSMEFPFICERSPDLTANEGSFSFTATNTASATTGTTNHAVVLYAGQLVTVATCGVPGATGTGDTYLRINDSTGTQVAFSDDAGGACGSRSNFSFVVPSSGTYTIRAGCFGTTSCSGTVAYNH
ncbi:lectin-like protein [Corallococcus terminator]|uniref:C-type lectin domain-containing protein n=1 Tax=Corallococcus terminator TaxID=2316733 RepID=A0A3A8JD61_9BACT|nr:lectin-like protein [Corallococcus terminator]RKG93777.1 hypothetical protein D7V88_01315 [Corallococcus terminator]